MFVLKQFLLYLLTFSFLIITLIPQNVTAANIVETFQDLLQQKEDALNVINNFPEQNGRVFETNIGKNENPDVILIYDVHCQPSVQKNIYSAINYFNSVFDIDKVFIEGAPQGKINISSFKNIPLNNKIKEKIFKNMLNKGLLSGTELYCYLSDKDNFYGIEDYNLYIDTVKQYTDILRYRKQFLKIINKSQNELTNIKSYTYNKDMRFFDDMFFGKLKDNDKTFDKIFSFIEKQNIDLKKDYPAFYKYLKIKEYDSYKKEKFYVRDFKNLLATAQIKLPASIYVKFVNNLKENNIEQHLVSLYNSTKQFLSEKQIQEYNYIEKLQEKLSLLKSFNVKNFLKEKDSLYGNLCGKIFNTDFTKNIIFLTEYLSLLDKYAQLKTDSESFKKLFDNVQSLETILSKKYLLSEEQDIRKILNNEKLNSYYKNNITRNDIFKKNILSRIEKGTVNIMVVGGFHKEIANLLAEKGIKYISILPNTYDGADYKTYNKIMNNFAHFYNALADTPLAALINEQGLNEQNLKIREFLIEWIKELKKEGQKDEEIITAINSWTKEYTEKASTNDSDITNFVWKQNKFSMKGWLLKTADFFMNFKTIFAFKYVKEEGDRDINLDDKTIKKIEKNIRHFPVMQIMLAAELFESFATVFMQASGFSLPFISSVIAVLPIISVIVSGLGMTAFGDNVPKKKLIVLSLIVHTIGTISFALAGFTGYPILLIIAEVFPTIGIAVLGLTLKPFLYEQLEMLGKENSFGQIYGTNISLFWLVMSVSSLFGSLFASAIGQTAVVAIAAIPDIVITSLTVITFLSTRRTAEDKKIRGLEDLKIGEAETAERQKQELNRFFEPLMKLAKNKKAFSYAAVNVIVNNIFIVVLSFFFQPSLESAGLNIGFFGAIYFAANMMQSISSNMFSRIKFIVEKHFVRNIIFAAMAALFALFVVTGHPIALILIFIAINFWQGVAGLVEDSAVYKTLDSDNQVRWNAFRSMFSMGIGFVSQISITVLLLFNIPNNMIIAGAIGILTIGSFVISQIFDREKPVKSQEISLSDSIINVVDTEFINNLLSAA